MPKIKIRYILLWSFLISFIVSVIISFSNALLGALSFFVSFLIVFFALWNYGEPMKRHRHYEDYGDRENINIHIHNHSEERERSIPSDAGLRTSIFGRNSKRDKKLYSNPWKKNI